jgi:phosphatidylinositol glycan anchor class Y biosynthesis protein
MIKLTRPWGYALIVLSIAVFMAEIYTVLVSKIMPYTGNRFLDAIKDDYVLCYAIPLLLPLFITFAFFNHFALRGFLRK